nr:RHS repeat-associated core domain-containing protein [Saccharibacillus qingshengii]
MQNVTQSTGGTSLNTKYSYNKQGAMTEKVFPDLTKITYGYDELGRRLSKTDSVLGQETYTYDNNSNLTGGTTRGGINVINQYDEQNRLTSWTSGDKNGSFTYYKNGLRKSMTDETGTTQYFYTLDNNLERMVYPDGKQISYTYYKNGLTSSMIDPFGLTTTYIYNTDNQLSEVRTDNTKQAEYVYRDGLTQSDENYLKSSQLYQLKLGDGSITTTYTNDGFGRLTNLLQSAGGLTQAFLYGYDNGDNITSRSDGATSGTFTYDELDRIITSSEGAETYTYDGKGNRLTLQSSIQMPHKDNVNYTYNQAEQLSNVTRNQISVSYKYNGDGLMTERSLTKNGQATTTRYYYDGANIIAEGTVAADGSVTFKARYVRGAQLIYREDASNQKAYYQHNGHGDVTGLVKADGTTLNRYTYDIWGNPLTADVQVESPFGYSGEFWDGDTGLQYLRSRWYDPSIGRFIQEDTFEGYVNRPSSLNPYTYVENNPLKYVDPSGYALSDVMTVKSAQTDAVMINLKGNNITVDATFRIHGTAANLKIKGTNKTYRQAAIEGMENYWQGDYDPVYRNSVSANVNITDLNDGNAYVLPKGKQFVDVEIVNDYGVSNVVTKNWGKDNIGKMTLYIGDSRLDNPKPKSESYFKWTAAHEFGHVLGVGDAYNLPKNKQPFSIFTAAGIPVQNKDMERVLEAFKYNKFYKFN